MTNNSNPALDADGINAARAHLAQPGWLPLLRRLHFYIGLLVGPFILVAAASGVLYALTPQIEDVVYRHALYTPNSGTALPLAEQVAVASEIVGGDGTLFAVRPAAGPGTTTRVMFVSRSTGPSESRAIFIDPATAEVRGDLGVYGTSGVLPIRSWIDQFHRGLHLGDTGRLYSELAASWLWIVALGGLVLWWSARRRERAAAGVRPAVGATLRRRHGTLGAWALIGFLFFSVTGLTWSQHAGGNISVLRAYYGWGTPSVSTSLDQKTSMPVDEHAHHGHGAKAALSVGADPAMFDTVLLAARQAGIDADKLEIRPPAAAGKAWTVTEIDRSWPTQVDAVAIDPRDLSVVDQTYFNEFPLAAKLTRWGIDAHMGALFGVANQLILIVFAVCLIVMIVWGYAMWWRKRPTQKRAAMPAPRGVLALLRDMPARAWLPLLIVAASLGWFLPLLGISLLAFLIVDAVVMSRP